MCVQCRHRDARHQDHRHRQHRLPVGPRQPQRSRDHRQDSGGRRESADRGDAIGPFGRRGSQHGRHHQRPAEHGRPGRRRPQGVEGAEHGGPQRRPREARRPRCRRQQGPPPAIVGRAGRERGLGHRADDEPSGREQPIPAGGLAIQKQPAHHPRKRREHRDPEEQPALGPARQQAHMAGRRERWRKIAAVGFPGPPRGVRREPRRTGTADGGELAPADFGHAEARSRRSGRGCERHAHRIPRHRPSAHGRDRAPGRRDERHTRTCGNCKRAGAAAAREPGRDHGEKRPCGPQPHPAADRPVQPPRRITDRDHRGQGAGRDRRRDPHARLRRRPGREPRRACRSHRHRQPRSRPPPIDPHVRPSQRQVHSTSAAAAPAPAPVAAGRGSAGNLRHRSGRRSHPPPSTRSPHRRGSAGSCGSSPACCPCRGRVPRCR